MQRSEWRKIDPKSQPISPRVPTNGAVPVRPTVPPWLLTAVGITVLALGLLAGYGIGHQEVAPLRRQAQQLQAANRALGQRAQTLQDNVAALTSCSDAQAQLDQVSGFVAKGEFATAADLAEALLTARTEPLCTTAHTAAAGLWEEASLRAILTTPRPSFPDLSLQQQLVAEYQRIEQQADSFGVPQDKRWDPMSVATLATNAGWWGLADAAFLEAWKRGTVGKEGITLRYALLRNEGNDLAFHGSATMRPDALRLLSTAHAIAKAYGLPNDPACGEDLRQLGYADCDSVAPNAADPVLAAAKQ